MHRYTGEEIRSIYVTIDEEEIRYGGLGHGHRLAPRRFGP